MTAPAGPPSPRDEEKALGAALIRYAIGLPFLLDFIFAPGIDVLPDLVAYIAFFVAAERLRTTHPLGPLLRGLALIVLPLGLATFLFRRIDLPSAFAAPIFFGSALLEIVVVGILVRLLFGVTEGRRPATLGATFTAAVAVFLTARFILDVLGVDLPPAGSMMLEVAGAVVVGVAVVNLARAGRRLLGEERAPFAERVPIAAEPPPEAPPPRAAILAVFLYVFAALAAIVSVLEDGIGRNLEWQQDWWRRPYELLFFGIACGTAVLLVGGMQARLRAASRLLIAGVALAVVFLGGFAGGDLEYGIDFLFLYFTPILGAIVVTGTGRHRWHAGQIVGATLMLIAVWRPIYYSLPALRTVFTASGSVPAYNVYDLYGTVIAKFWVETTYGLVGLLLFFGALPLVHARPTSLGAAFDRMGMGIRRGWILDLGLGAMALTITIIGDVVVASLLRTTGGSDVGADDSGAFSLITPDLVILLSLAAGIGEELLFRGLLLPYLERGFRSLMPAGLAFAIALLLQGLLFGIIHSGYQNLSHVVLPLVFGLFMGLVYRFWGFAACVYAHVAIDVVAFGFHVDEARFPWMGAVVVLFILLNIIAGVWALFVLGLRWLHKGPTGAATKP